MGWKDLFKRAEVIETESDDAVDDALFRASLTPERIDASKAMGIPAFGSGVNTLAGIAATLPIKLYRRTGDTVEEVRGDPRVRMLNGDTGDTLTAPQMKRMFVKDYLTDDRGGFIFIDRRGNRVRSLRYVECSQVTRLRNVDPIFKDVQYQVMGATYEPWQFIHIARNSRDGAKGTSLVTENAEALGVAYSTMRFEQNLVKRGGNKRGFVKSPRKLGNDAFNALKAAWRKFYGDTEENVILLNDGVEFQEASNTSVEMQLNENKETNANDIYGMLRMSPKIIRGGASDNDSVNLVRFSLMDILADFKAALNRDLLLEAEKDDLFFDFDLTEFTKADLKTRWEAWGQAKRDGLVGVDEFRKAENMPPLGVDYINLGLQDVLFDPRTRKIIVPNMGTVIDLDDLPVGKPAPQIQQAKPQDPAKGGDQDED